MQIFRTSGTNWNDSLSLIAKTASNSVVILRFEKKQKGEKPTLLFTQGSSKQSNCVNNGKLEINLKKK